MLSLDSFGLAVAGGVCGAVLTQAATSIRDLLNRRDEGRFTALTLALILEDYAAKCVEPTVTLNNYVSTGYQSSEPSGSVPGLPEYPEKTNWRSIRVRFASEVLGFRVKVDSANSYLGSVWEFEGNVSAWGEAAGKSVELGSAALDLAKRLRSAFNLPAATKESGFDAESWFAEKMAELEARRALIAEQNAKMFADLAGAGSDA